MFTNHDGSFKGYDSTFNLDRPNFIVTSQLANPSTGDYQVRIYSDVKSGHKSQSPGRLDEHPTIHWLIPHVIARGRHYASTSQQRSHLARSSRGHTEVYQLDNIYELYYNEIDWASNMPSHSMVVPVFYPFDGKPNKAVTFYIAPNPSGKQLG